MPLKLRPPRPGKTPNYEVRGTYLGISVERSARTPDRRLAKRVKRSIEQAIERGEFQKAEVVTPTLPPTFLSAAVAYLKAGGETKYLGVILEATDEHALRDKLLCEIDQMTIDNAANELYPNATAQTKNRQFYTPVSAVLKRAGVDLTIKRPKGWRGKKSKSYLEPGQAFFLLDAANAIDREFGLLCTTLLYTGMRIGEALSAKLGHLQLDRAALYVPDPKNEEPRTVYLPSIVVKAFQNMPSRKIRPRKASTAQTLPRGEAGRSQLDAGVPFLARSAEAKLFRFHQGGHLRDLLSAAMGIAGLSFPRRQRGFHLFCHTYGSWMVRFGKLDNFGLTRTGRWKDPRSAEVYVHTEINSEARLADSLPTPPLRGISGDRSQNQS
jgi:integrase